MSQSMGLTIVMYHYVRKIANSQFPNIKGLEFEGFRGQLDYLEEHYNIVSTEEVISAVMHATALPARACWLTFDDGYKDHYQFVLPELNRRNLTAAFFPPRVAICEDIVLDVNLIHFSLANCSCIDDLVLEVNSTALEAGISTTFLDNFYRDNAIADRYDDAETIYVKRLLQHGLPDEIRSSVASRVFESQVGIDMKTFSRQLYLSKSEVKELVSAGMYVGSHGSRHVWLDSLSAKDQELEITQSLEFLEDLGMATTDWIMCYPYGAYNGDTLNLLNRMGAAIGVTTEVRMALVGVDNPLIYPRFDTNDFPQ